MAIFFLQKKRQRRKWVHPWAMKIDTWIPLTFSEALHVGYPVSICVSDLSDLMSATAWFPLSTQRSSKIYIIKSDHQRSTLQGPNISPKNGILKMSFLFPRWDMLIPWRVTSHFRQISYPKEKLGIPSLRNARTLCILDLERKKWSPGFPVEWGVFFG